MQDINDVIESNLGLVYSQLTKLRLLNDQDAESFGYEALYNAILSFDDSKGAKFSTYATCCIYNALCMHIRALNKKRQLDVSSYNTIVGHNDEEVELLYFLPGEQSAEHYVLQEEATQMLLKAFDQCFCLLSNEKHKLIVSMWQASQYTMTASSIARQLGVSQSYVSVVLSNFKAKVKRRMERYNNG